LNGYFYGNKYTGFDRIESEKSKRFFDKISNEKINNYSQSEIEFYLEVMPKIKQSGIEVKVELSGYDPKITVRNGL